MPLVDLSNAPLPNDDENADAADVSLPIQAILAVVNGHIDTTNIEPGGLAWSVMGSFTDEIPAAAMEHEGNAKKMRDELSINRVASGLLWSTVSGLNGQMSTGVLYAVDGSRVDVAAIATHGFTASKDTYVDISSAGSVSYSEVSNGASAPALSSGYLRLAKVVTGASSISSITDMRKLTGNGLVYAKLVNQQQTTSTTPQANSELTLQVTVEKDNSIIELTAFANVSVPSGQSPAGVQLSIYDGSTAGTQLDLRNIQLATSNSTGMDCTLRAFVTKNRGTHTFLIALNRTGGTSSHTVTLSAGATFSAKVM